MDYLIQRQYWVSLCTAGLAGFVQLLKGAEQPVKSLFIFFASLIVYNLEDAWEAYVSYRENKVKKTGNALPKDLLEALSIGISGCGLLVLKIPIDELYILVPVFFLSFFYSIPLYWGKGKSLLLREVSGAKIFWIALSWGLVIGVFTLDDYSAAWKTFGLIFCFTLGITIPFDIRDLTRDAPAIKTLPQGLGAGKAKALALLCLLASLGFLFSLQPSAKAATAYGLSALISGLLVLGSGARRSNFYYAFWVESCSLWPLPLVLLLGLLA